MTVHYEEYGDKSSSYLLLFLHGGGVSGWMWDQQIQHFHSYYCIVPDLTEHGGSKGQFTIQHSAEEIAQLIEQKAHGRTVVVVGFSLGAQVVVQLLSDRTGLIDYAIINSALVRTIPFAKPFIKPAVKLTYPLIKYKWFSNMQAKALYIQGRNLEKYYEENRQIKVDSLLRVLEENMAFTIPPDYSKSETKILITVGETEKSIMHKSAKDLVNAHAGSKGIIIHNVGHGAPLAMPAFFNHMVEAWIQGKKLPKGYTEIRKKSHLE